MSDSPRFAGFLSCLPVSPALKQFLCFGMVGGCGFLTDSVTLLLARPFLGLVTATMGSYLVAASVTWFLNRHWTFSCTKTNCALPPHHQWRRFLAVNLPGYGLNRGTVLALYALLPITKTYPVAALAAGALVGMTANFTLAKKYVFHAERQEPESRKHYDLSCPAS